MDLFLAVLAIAALFAGIMAVLAWLRTRVRRRGGGAGEAFMGPFEEMWHPAAHRARFEALIVEERVVPMPSPDDQWSRNRRRRPGRAEGV